MDVGVRDLKQHLSEYLERAARGEVVRVTDRGVPKAQIVAIDSEGAGLQRGVDEGWLRPALRRGLPSAPRAKAAAAIRDVMAQDRDE